MMINAKAFTLIPMLVLLLFFHISLVSCHKNVNSFSVHLIHRDSPLSPFHNPSNSRFERLQNAFHRSFSRAAFLKKKCVNPIQSTIIPDRGEYLMKISIGTPPIDTFVIVDTGSDLTWTQCEPCVDCYKQLAPVFNPKNSSSYKIVDCNNKLCQEVDPIKACKNNTCNYEVNYGDQSHTEGDLSIETFTFATTSGENVSIPNIAFGCGYANKGTFSNTTSGIIGLGGGNVSIVNQMNQQIKRKFSYCLIPLDQSSPINPNVTSHINFGDSAVVSGPGVVSTPLFKKVSSTFYYLNMKGISVGNKTAAFRASPISPPTSDHDQGNIIIDSGTTLTFVPDAFYLNFGSLVMESINATKKDDPLGTFNLCYEPNENGTIDVPKIVAHFTNADLELSPSSVFALVDEGLACMTIVPGNLIAIFGNLLQSNFLIGYDLVANKVSFKPTDCTKY